MGAYGLDLDRTAPPEPLWERLRRRAQGRFVVDPFGADPLLQDALAPWVSRLVSVEVEGIEAVPEIGPAVLACHRRAAPAVAEAVRAGRRRRARVVGYPEVPVVGGLARRLGRVRAGAADLAAVLRAGHVAVVPSPTAPVMLGALGFPVLPVAVAGGPVGRHRVLVGAPLELDVVPHDPLSAAELAEAARAAVADLAQMLR